MANAPEMDKNGRISLLKSYSANTILISMQTSAVAYINYKAIFKLDLIPIQIWPKDKSFKVDEPTSLSVQWN